MKDKYLLLLIVFIFHIFKAESQKLKSTVFPEVSEPIQITSNGKEHLFASYYGINSWSKNQRYVTVLETDLKFKIPDVNEPATLGLVDLKTKKFIPLVQTNAWNFQQGCMAHWLATNPDSVIIYNDFRKGKFVSVMLNVINKRELRTFPYPIAAVSPDGKEALVINFARLRITRTDYGYAGEGQDAKPNIAFPEDEGISLLNLQTGECKLVIPLSKLKGLVPEIKDPKGIEYIGHVLFSKDGSKFFFLARATPEWNTMSFTANKDGSMLQKCFPANWGGSHFDWLNDGRLLVTAMADEKNTMHILFTPGKTDYKKIGDGKLEDRDGHGTFSPDGKWMVTDTYPDKDTRNQHIYLLNMETEEMINLGEYREPENFNGGWRADIHCRWSPNGDMIGFNSTHTGSRQVYIMNLKYK